MTDFSQLQPGDWIWICNWTAKDPHKSEMKKKAAGKGKEESLIEPSRIAAHVKGQPTQDRLVADPIWGSICEKCSKEDKYAPETQPAEIVMTPGGLSKSPGPDNAYPVKMEQSNIEGRTDMTELSDLGVGELMHCLRMRYQSKMKDIKDGEYKMLIYTYVGDIVIVANPMMDIKVTTDEVKLMYCDKKLGDPDLEPHIFAIADSAYRALQKTNMNQAIVISGESGAGKSESTKHVLEYLSFAASQGREATNVNKQILATSEVLEAFGNAKTKRNHNSSRFGKFVQVQFTQAGDIMGAEIVQYLLEKSRITDQEATERNYHIFYMMLVNLGGELSKYHLTKVDDYRYLIGAVTPETPKGANINSWMNRPDGTSLGDDKKWPEFLEFCTTLGLDDNIRNDIYLMMASVLLMGQIDFKEIANGAEITNPEVVDHIASMLQLPPDDLKRTLLKKKIMKDYKNFNKKQACDNVDALAKALYGSVFISLVEEYINPTITNPGNLSWIGVLDIFGFESFEEHKKDKKSTWVETLNKFEQLCINLTNEQLQSFFYNALIPKQLDKYKAEGLEVKDIEWADNAECLNMCMGKKDSLFALLDGISKQAETNRKFQENPELADKQWLVDIKAKYKGAEKNLTRAEGAKMKKPVDFLGYQLQDVHHGKAETDFCVFHYAGQVWYTVFGAVERNKDKVSGDLTEVMSSSEHHWVKKLFAEKEGGGKASTVSAKFAASLKELDQKLNTTNPFFARCVKPNCMMIRNGFLEDHKVLDQLICAGMSAVIDMRQAGYPVERVPPDFAEQFLVLEDDKEMLLKKSIPEQVEYLCNLVEKKRADEIIDPQAEQQMKPWQIGKTKVFLKDRMFKAMMAEKTIALMALKEKQRGVVCHIKALYAYRKEQPLYEEKEKAYKRLEPILKEKRELIKAGKSPEEAEKIMEAKRIEMERQIEEAYRNDHFVPIEKALAPAIEPVPESLAEIDTFLANPYMNDTSNADRVSWKNDVAARRKALADAKTKAQQLFDKFKDDYHNEPLADETAAAISALQELVNVEPDLIKKDVSRMEYEIENAEKMEQEEKERVRQEELRKQKEEEDEKERARLEEIRRQREEEQRKEAERQAKIKAEQEKRRQEKLAVLEEKRRAKQAKLDQQKKKEREEKERADKLAKEREEAERKEREKAERKKLQEKKEELRASAPTAALKGTLVKFEDMVCTVKFVGALPYEGSGTYVGIQCPKKVGVMTSGMVMDTHVFDAEDMGKFVRPDMLHLIDLETLNGEPKEKIAIGDLVWVRDTKYVGVVKFRDTVRFAAGEWVGILLEEQGTGKNNGTVSGQYYFSCPEKTGVFARPTRLVRVKPFDDGFIKQATDRYCDDNDLTTGLDDDLAEDDLVL